MTVGGASGPLYGSFFLAAGDALASKQLPADLADVFGSGVERRQCARAFEGRRKDHARCPVPGARDAEGRGDRPDLIARVRATAREAAARTAPMQATKGRASYLGARSVGHVDPGARSSCVLVHAVCDTLEARS